MGIKRAGGFAFMTHKTDHPPLHVHIRKDRGEIGRWDIENQRPMDGLVVSGKLARALRATGFMKVLANGDD